MSTLATQEASATNKGGPLSGPASLFESLQIQVRVVRALIMREILTRYGRHNIGFMWLFAEPMLFTLGVTALWTLMGHSKGHGISITAFVLTGYSALLLWRNVPARCVLALQPNFSLMFHRGVQPIDVYFARIALEVIGATMSFVLLTISLHALELVSLPYDYLTVWGAWALLSWYAACVGLLIGALSERTEVVEKLWHPMMYLLVPLSGSFFMASALPPAVRDTLLFLPTVHCNEMLRAGFFGPAYEWYYSVGYVVVFNMFLMLFGLSQVRYVSRHLTLAE